MDGDKRADKPTGDVNQSQSPTYFKYCSDDNRVIEGIFACHKIRFTQPAALNDPLEFNPIVQFEQNEDRYTNYAFDGVVFPSYEVWFRIQLVESQLNRFGILSLTKIPDCFDMWSRYANGHKGFLLELKPDFNKYACMRGKDGKVYEVREVAYVDSYAINIGDLVDEHGKIPLDTYAEQAPFTKTSRWKHEKEYRMVRPLQDRPTWVRKSDKAHRDRESCYLFDFSLECIQSVTFGACMSVENKKSIAEACEGTGIRSLQAIIVRDTKDSQGLPCSVRRVSVESFPNLLRMADVPMFAEQENMDKRRAPAADIGQLSALPYYNDSKEWVAQYYNNAKAQRDQ